jgi:ATP-dependent 26S proteasome regulatory subunit
VIELPRPDADQRRLIWAAVWPPATPLAPDVDLDRLAGFELSGGNIRNVALASAFLAVRDDDVIGLRHVLAAVRREYQKMGQVLSTQQLAELAS